MALWAFFPFFIGFASGLVAAALAPVKNPRAPEEMVANRRVADAARLAELRRGQSPTVKRGPHKGDQLPVDRAIPRAVAPELDTVIANLELTPLRMNEGKNAEIGTRQLDHARKLHAARLLSAAGLKRMDLPAGLGTRLRC